MEPNARSRDATCKLEHLQHVMHENAKPCKSHPLFHGHKNERSILTMTVAVGGCALGFSNLNANAINSNMAVSEIRKTISTVQYSTIFYIQYSDSSSGP